MNKLFEVFRFELKRNIQRKGYLFATFGLPILFFVAAFGYNAISGFVEDQTDQEAVQELFDFDGIERAGYVDLSGSFEQVPEAMQDRLLRYEDEETAGTALAAGEVDVYYVIAEDYLETGNVTLHAPGLAISLLNTAPIEQLVYSTLIEQPDRLLLQRLRSESSFQEFNLARAEGETQQNRDSDFLMLYVFAIMFLLGLFLTNGYLMQTVIDEKENRLIEILIASIRPWQLLGGKIFALGLLGMVQILVWAGAIILLLQTVRSLPAFASVSALININVPVDRLPVMFAYFVLGYLFFASLYGAVGALSRSMREGPQFAVIFTLPAALPYYFFAVFIEQPNSTLPVFMSMFPLTSPISMMMRLSVTNVPLGEVLLSLGLLALSVIAAMWVAARLFRVNTLLSGQVPKLSDIPRLIRG